jgi:hypothetical protein
MRKRDSIGVLVVLLAALSASWGQDSSAQQPEGAAPASVPQQPVPAYGTDNPAPPINDNPPITGLDVPNLEPHAAPLSYLQAGAHVSESADSNVSDTLGGSGFHSVSRALGSLTLQRLWSHYDLALEYLGGIGYYNAKGLGVRQVQQLDVNQKIEWKRGQLGVRDSFSYLPEGNFASAYGSVNAGYQTLGGGAFGGQSVPLGGSTFGSLGQVPRIMNLSIVDVQENLSPKSAVTATGGYGVLHYTGSNPGIANLPFLGSTQLSAQAGYDRFVGRHNQVAISYAYQGFNFSIPGFATGGSPITLSTAFHTDVVQVMLGHRISGRMDFLAAAGPQITLINTQQQVCTFMGLVLNVPPQNCAPGTLVTLPEKSTRLTVSGRVALRYHFTKTSLSLAFDRYTTAGSGIFPGANSNIARVSANRPVSRVWTASFDTGYARNSRVLPGGGTVATKYSYAFAGFGLNRKLGHDFRVFGSYEFNYLSFDNSFCGTTTTCGRISQRHVGTIGLDWTPRPMRID